MRIHQGLHHAGCVEMKEQAQAHYFGIMLVIAVPV